MDRVKLTFAHCVGSYVAAALIQSIVYHTHKLWDAMKTRTCAWEQPFVFEEMIGNVVDMFSPMLRRSKTFYDRELHRTDQDVKDGVHILVVEFEESTTSVHGKLSVRSDKPRDKVRFSYGSFGDWTSLSDIDVFSPVFVDKDEGA